MPERCAAPAGRRARPNPGNLGPGYFCTASAPPPAEHRFVGACGDHTGTVRVTVRVRPGSPRPGVGGEHDGALVVRVSAPAVDGRATEAALRAIAAAFGVRRRAVTLIAGAASRTKIVEVAGADPVDLDRLLSL